MNALCVSGDNTVATTCPDKFGSTWINWILCYIWSWFQYWWLSIQVWSSISHQQKLSPHKRATESDRKAHRFKISMICLLN